MNICMAGIDYNIAGIDIREKVSFTKRTAAQFLKKLKHQYAVSGCVLLSTCNRVELWVSTADEFKDNLADILCREKGVDTVAYAEYFHEKKGKEAVSHLFYLTAGLKSQIIGEDQILTQVKDALMLARDAYCTNQVLEVLFRMAVTAGKEIKTKLAMPKSNQSAARAAIEQLELEGYKFGDKKCLVIGNGIMGKLAAQLLIEKDADVTVTIRQYKRGIIDTPRNVKRIEYEKRYEYITDCDYVISATASPNVTIKKEFIENMKLTSDKIFVDLAVPRDIELSVRDIPYVKCYDMDYFKIDIQSEKLQEILPEADKIIDKHRVEFEKWYDSRDIVPQLMCLSERAAQDVLLRLNKPVKKVVAQADREELQNAIENATQKVINKIMFEIRDTMNGETFRDCITAMEKLYESEI